MQDYYNLFLDRYSHRKLESEETKVTIAAHGSNRTADSDNEAIDSRLLGVLDDPEMREQFDFEIAERTERIMLDTNVDQLTATRHARRETEIVWIDLFIPTSRSETYVG